MKMDHAAFPERAGSYIKEIQENSSIKAVPTQGKEVESVKEKMNKARLENERLKAMLEEIQIDFQLLQAQFYEATLNRHENHSNNSVACEEIEELELVSLRLGQNTKSLCKEPSKRVEIYTTDKTFVNGEDEEGLTLGLHCNFEDPWRPPNCNMSLEKGLGVTNKDEWTRETCPHNKLIKRMKRIDEDDNIMEQQSPTKRARVSVRSKCDGPLLNDGCQWRKYGHKVAKGNPHPRAYYRCTVAPSCTVKKQVQRCAEDASMLITTYEGTHNHPLPLAATAMASTTAAAISLLDAGPLRGRGSASSTGFHGFSHFTSAALGDTFGSGRLCSLNLPSSSSSGHPTITLDLATDPSSSTNGGFPLGLRLPPTRLTIASTESSHCLLPTSYRSQDTLPYTTTLSKRDTLTKAITTDPNFQSALATTISSMVGGDGAGTSSRRHEAGGDNTEGKKPMRWEW